MWKYVSRRLKDTLERTSNILDVSRNGIRNSSSGSGDKICGDNNELGLVRKKSGCLLGQKFFKFQSSSESTCNDSSGSSEDNQKRLHPDRVSPSWIGALTWSSAIVCGWYTSQLLCMRRKHLVGWSENNRCRYSNALLTSTRSIHSNISSRVVYATPPLYADIAANRTSSGQFVYNVNNTQDQQKDNAEAHIKVGDFSEENQKHAIENAVHNLCSTIGEIEFQFGTQNLIAGEYKTAVSHLKLATTHHHAGATFNLGLCYEQGLGVDKNLKTAMECYQVASALGHPKAMYNLGVFYVRGLGGLKRSRKVAQECFLAAARLGVTEAKKAMELKHKSEMMKHQSTQLEPQLLSSWGVKAF